MSTTDAQTRVLLVEDEPAAREASELYLTLSGFQVATAGSEAEAHEVAERAKPDILVCDWKLGGGGSGVDVARKIRHRYSIPIIFVSAHPLDELRQKTADIEVSAYLAKPLSLPRLVDTIVRVVSACD